MKFRFGIQGKIKEKYLGLLPEYGSDNESNRHVWVQKKLESLAPGLKILDVGAGQQPYRKYCTHLKYIAHDFGEYDGQGNHVGLHTEKWDTSKVEIRSDICSIPLEKSSIDVVLCTEVLEHVFDPISAIKEMLRILKPGGEILLTAPFASLTHFAPFHFATGFNRYFFEEVFRRENVAMEEIAPSGNYYEFIAQEIRRLPKFSKDYSSASLSWKDEKILRKTLGVLQKLGAGDKNSSEVLSFEYLVRGKKSLT